MHYCYPTRSFTRMQSLSSAFYSISPYRAFSTRFKISNPFPSEYLNLQIEFYRYQDWILSRNDTSVHDAFVCCISRSQWVPEFSSMYSVQINGNGHLGVHFTIWQTLRLFIRAGEAFPKRWWWMSSLSVQWTEVFFIFIVRLSNFSRPSRLSARLLSLENHLLFVLLLHGF